MSAGPPCEPAAEGLGDDAVVHDVSPLSATRDVSGWSAARPAMGTMISVHVYGGRDSDSDVEHAVDQVFAEIERCEAVLSTFRRSSDVSRINRGELHVLDADPMVVEVLDACTWLEHASNGAFRAHPPDRPDQIDPAGFAKGWITERAAGLLTAAGFVDWYVGAGGDVITSGRPGSDRRWRVGITDPFDRSRLIRTLEVESGAVATSGAYERGEHVWDGRSGAPALGLASLTVTGPSLAWADAYATAGLAMGAEGVAWVSQFAGYHAIAVHPDATVTSSPALAGA